MAVHASGGTGRTQFALALLLDLLGGAGALLVALRTWQVVTTARPRPLADDVLRLSGRAVDAASTALALAALAGVVAVLATKGLARRVVGGVLALAGAGLVWRAVAAAGAIGAGRARALVMQRHRTVSVDPRVDPSVSVHTVWPALSLACGVLVLAGGFLVAARGHRWRSLSARYEVQPERAGTTAGAEPDPARAAATLWTALDRGEDPTAR